MYLLLISIEDFSQEQLSRIGVHIEQLVTPQRIGLEAIAHQGILTHVRITRIRLENHGAHCSILRDTHCGIVQGSHKNRSMIVKVRDANVQVAVDYISRHTQIPGGNGQTIVAKFVAQCPAGVELSVPRIQLSQLKEAYRLGGFIVS